MNRIDTPKFIGRMFEEAKEARASDIHIEPFADHLRIRFRIDGILNDHCHLSMEDHSALVTALKIRADIDIAERRLPQDGRFNISGPDFDLDVRCATIGTIYGETMNLRLLDPEIMRKSHKDLGFDAQTILRLQVLCSRPNGMILLTGPTGSGKTTTLYSLIQNMDSDRSNIMTIEDPVEYNLPGVNQIQVNPQAGMTFERGLRSILRQDPDVIFVGEIRDRETAEIATRAAITGHSVLSTLHTGDALSAIIRLADMGVEAYLIAAALSGVCAQRLLRVLCPHCKSARPLTEGESMIYLDMGLKVPEIVYEPVGCPACVGGYKGRTVVLEVIEVDALLRENIRKDLSTIGGQRMRENLGQEGIFPAGLKLVTQGRTSLQELLRVCMPESGS